MRFFTILFIFIALFTQGQIKVNIVHKDYHFDKTTALTNLPAEDSVYNVVYVIDKTINELYATNSFKGQTLNQDVLFNFYTIHKRVRLNNDEAVEQFNTMYIPVSGDEDLLSIKARSINPDGTITNFDEKNIKFVENYENHGPMKIFAFEGVQVGAEIEYVYTIQEYDNSFYGAINIQSSFPKKEFGYEYIFPSRLVFKTKGYNNAPEMILDTISDTNSDTKHRLTIASTPVSAFEEEDNSADDAAKQRIEYVLSYNTGTEKGDFYSWKEASEVYTNYPYNFSSNPKLAKKEKKALKKIIKAMDPESITNEKEKIQFIENYIKTKININNDFGITLIHEIYKEKLASEFGGFRLFVQILTKLDIEHQMVLTSSRFRKKFDGDFETFNFLYDRLVYFPQYDAYTHPASFNFRFGQIPFGFAYTDGLFFKMKEIGGVKAFYPQVKYIDGLAAKYSYDNLTIDLKISDDFEQCNLAVNKEMLGYNASNSRPFIGFLNDEKKEELYKDLIKSVGDGAEVISVKAKNTDMKGYMLDYPFILDGEVKVSSILEKAGPKYLVKIGQAIGPQMEMYQEKERKTDVENYYNHGYKRVINFTIPDGYTITNLEDLSMDFYREVAGKRTMEFTCKYELKGNILTITVNEFYDEIRVPAADFEEFRTVINAAADFNKKVLILEKK